MSEGERMLEALLERLRDRGHIHEEELRRIRTRSEKPETDLLYARILAGAGAWVAASFLLRAIGLTGLFDDNALAAAASAFLTISGLWINRSFTSTFTDQLTLALVTTGHIRIIIAGIALMEPYMTWSASGVLLHALLTATVWPLYRNDIYRFLAPVGLAPLIVIWIVEAKSFFLIHALIGVETVAAGWLLLLPRCRPGLAPLRYAGAFILPATVLFLTLVRTGVVDPDFRKPLWPSSLIISTGLVYVYIRLFGAGRVMRERPMRFIVFATVLFGALTAPGIPVALVLLILGHALGDHPLSGLGWSFLGGFLILFYYALDIDLAHKAWALAGSGVLLLIVRHVISLREPEAGEPS